GVRAAQPPIDREEPLDVEGPYRRDEQVLGAREVGGQRAQGGLARERAQGGPLPAGRLREVLVRGRDDGGGRLGLEQGPREIGSVDVGVPREAEDARAMLEDVVAE